MQVALSELKTNVGTNRDRVADMKSLFGIAKPPKEYDDPNYDPN